MARLPKQLTDEQCLETMQGILMKTIKAKDTVEKDKRAAISELLKVLAIKNKLKGEDDDGNFFNKRG